MSVQPQINPQPPEHINNRHEHPLKDFLILAAAAIALVTLLALGIRAGAGKIAPFIPYEWEVRTLQGIAADSPDEKEIALTALLAKLTPKDALQTRIHYLEDEEMPNAFASLGGHIFVTKGLLDAVESENGLAMVMAHEYAHIALRHPVIGMMEQLSLGTLLSLTGISSGAGNIANQTSLLHTLAFSRDMERAADDYALTRLQSVYGHAVGADEFFQSIQNQAAINDSQSRWAAFTQTHPLTQERIDNISRNAGKGTPSPMPEALRAHSSHQDE